MQRIIPNEFKRAILTWQTILMLEFFQFADKKCLPNKNILKKYECEYEYEIYATLYQKICQGCG
ncbi:MAG: hypothetical protein Q8M83_05780 [bacterium]|nr:hypothetical protein [bacterium]